MDARSAAKPSMPDPVAPAQPSLRQRVQALRLPDDDELTSGRRRWIVWLVIVAIVLGGGYVAYRVLGDKEAAPAAVAASNDAAARPVSTSKPVVAMRNDAPAPVASSGQIALESKGYIIPAHQILVSPQVAGVLIKFNIEEGQRVVKDEVLAEIETTEYDADFRRAQANVAGARQRFLELEAGFREEEKEQSRAELEEAEAQRSQLYAEWQRMLQLRRNNVITPSEYDLAEANYKTSDKRVERLRKAYDLIIEGPRIERIEAARADLALAQAEQAKAKWRLDNCTIRAPISGTILKKNAEEGNIVNPVAFNGSFSLCEMADLSDLEVDLSIQERDISKVFKGQQCKVRAEAWPDRVYEGYVSRLMPIADRAKGAVPVRVKVQVPADEEGVYLKPEMGAVVSFLKRDDHAAAKDAGDDNAPQGSHPD